jgi:Bacteriophage translational regulator
VIEMSVDNLIEVTLAEKDDFLKVRETLTRIGVAAKKENVLYQSCHILHKQSKYYIVHFKELFALDGKPSSIVENDIARRNAIINLLSEWGLIKVVDAEKIKEPIAPLSQIKIIAFKDKNNWQLVAKYNIGKKKKEVS